MQKVATSSAPVNAGARLDRLPISTFHWRILGLVSAGAFLDSFDIYLAGGVMAAMLHEGFSSLETNAAFVSATFAGMLIGAGAAGLVGDRYGRRFSYQANLLVFSIASLAAVFAPNMPWLIGCRFFMGLGLGAELVVAAGTLCEFVPPSHRGRWTSLMALIISSGLMVATSVGYLVIPTVGWRPMFAIAGVGGLIVWLLRKRMPESPRWLELVGRHQEAEAIISALETEAERRRGTLPSPTSGPAARRPVAPFSALFRSGRRGRTLVAALVAVAANIAIYGFVAWLPTFFVREGLTVAQSLGFTTLMSFGSSAGALIGFAVADRVPRRWAITMACMVIAVIGWVYPQVHAAGPLALVGFALVASIYTFVAIGIYAYIPELFPTDLRLRGTGLASVCGRAAAITTPYMAVGLFQQFGVRGVLLFLTATLAVLVASVLTFGVETSGTALE